MAVATEKLTRVFKMGSVQLPDPMPGATPEEAIKVYAASYPHLAHATLAEPVVSNGQLVYEVVRAPAKTKG